MAQGIENMTPMMKQYLEIKSDYQDSILFFRLGDFYEMFFEDAIKASRILNIALTSRNKNSKDSVPLCGIPFHSSKNYIAKLVKAGCKVAVCEQIEDPKSAKGVVKREVIQVITPGLFLDLENLDAEQPNFILCVYPTGKNFHLVALDILTGETACGIFERYDDFVNELCKFNPSEVLILGEADQITKELNSFFPQARIEKVKTVEDFTLEESNEDFNDSYYQLGMELQSEQIYESINTLLNYAALLGSKAHRHLKAIQILKVQNYLNIDNRTARHLELIQNAQDRGNHGTLFWAINRSKTPMGARLLRKLILFPLLDQTQIIKRQDAIEEWMSHYAEIEGFQNHIARIGDLERVLGRLSTGSAHPKDLAQIRDNLDLLMQFKEKYQGRFSSELLKDKIDKIPDLLPLCKILQESLVDDPPFHSREGGIFRSGYHSEVDELKKMSTEAKTYIAQLEEQERRSTGIPKLKIKYNRVFGYYIEVSNSYKDRTPGHYVRKQTLANAERFITEELKILETKVLGAVDRLKSLEASLFESLKSEVFKFIPLLKKASENLAWVDVFAALALHACESNYVRPKIEESKILQIQELRHPVLEKIMGKDKFIPNDIDMDGKIAPIYLVTGPNMAGKSTIMKQLAIACILAQMGSFVPARSAVIGKVDQIMSRIGANDDLSQGMSTFMVEMIETAQILKRARDKSLLLLDEIGRGTSTYDGLAIAWAILQKLDKEIQCRTLFSTHYHELTEMSSSSHGIQNFHIAVKEFQGDLVFLRKLVEGACSRSYGIEVAKLAGLDEELIEDAKKKLSQLEKDSLIKKSNKDDNTQYDLFCQTKFDSEIEKEISALNIQEMTPLQALNLLSGMKKRLESDAK